VGEAVGSGRPISDEAKKKCFGLGKELAKKVLERSSMPM